MKRLPIVAALAMCVVAGCGLVAGIEETTTVVPDAGSVPVSVDSATDALLPDPVDDIDGGPEVKPDPGDGGVADSGITCPKPTVFVPSLSKVVSKVCNATEEEALVAGGNFTGLDAVGTGVETSKEGVTVTACVGFDFGSAKLDYAIIGLFAVEKGCTNTCYSGGCDNVATARVFVGTDRIFGNWIKAGYSKVPSAPDDYRFNVPAGDFHVVAVCRGGAGAQYEDVAVDGVTAACR